jgi:hypothetical protein
VSLTKIKCPHCLATIDVLEALAESDLRAVIEMQDAFYPHGRLVRAYFELFGVWPGFKKIHRLRVLTEEMRSLFDHEEFTYDRRTYRISRAGIAEALTGMVKRRFPAPLENHNYLKKVMIGIAEREVTASSKANERGLRKREGQLMAGNRENPDDKPTAEQIEANKQRVKDLQSSIFKKHK